MGVSIRIAVSDPLPMYRRGLIAVLGDAGFEPQTPDELITWIRAEQRPIVLLSLLSSNDWMLLARLHEIRDDTMVIAVSGHEHSEPCSRRLSMEQSRQWRATRCRRPCAGSLMPLSPDKSVLPVEVVRALTTSQPLPEEDETVPAPQENRLARNWPTAQPWCGWRIAPATPSARCFGCCDNSTCGSALAIGQRR